VEQLEKSHLESLSLVMEKDANNVARDE
jgi:hypothetical protein